MNCIGRIMGYILLSVNGMVTLALLLSAYSSHIDPQTHPVWACAGLFFPVFLLLNLFFLIFWLVVYRRYLLLPVLAFLLCWGAIRTYFPINIGKDVPEDAIKVLSYNTQAFGEKDRHTKEKQNGVLAYLQESNADIICLQEYIWGGKLKKKDIDYALRGYRYKHYYSLGDGLNGLGVYSRYPILSAVPISYKSARNGSIAYRIKVKDDTLLVVNNHFESNKIVKSDVGVYQDMMDEPSGEKLFWGTRKLLGKMAKAAAIRGRQADVVLETVKKAKEKYIVVCGDFNDTPISYIHRVFHEELDNAFVESGNGMGISYNRDRLYVRIDHIFISKNLQTYECRVDDEVYASDHYPISCYISFPKDKE